MFNFFKRSSKTPKRLWLDLGDLGSLVYERGPHEQWHDHGMGLLRTILHRHGINTDLLSARACTSWKQIRRNLSNYEMLLMNVRSYTFPLALMAAKHFKEQNPKGVVIVGGMHANVALDEMTSCAEFDRICQGPGENLIVDLVCNPEAFPRVISGNGARSMAEWPMIERTLWPKPSGRKLRRRNPWPLEPACGWGPPPVATVLTSRVCPWHCVFCNESSYIPFMGRRPVEAVIEELNRLDTLYGPIGSVVIHDSLFFQNRKWLEEWLEKYPRLSNRIWPYWAAARADTIRRWPDLFSELIRHTNWQTISIGLESGSDRVLNILNKECSEQDNYYAIDLINTIGDDLESKGLTAPTIWANIIMAVPGETREDALKTIQMIGRIKRVFTSVAFFAPYPGSVLGYQLIAEGKSLITKDGYDRYPYTEKVSGIDYSFYRQLLKSTNLSPLGSSSYSWSPPGEYNGLSRQPSFLYLFTTKSGKKKLAYGSSPQEALQVLNMRLTEDEMRNVLQDDWIRISYRNIQQYLPMLG